MLEERREILPSTLVILATLNEEQGVGLTLAEIRSHLDKSFCLVVDGRSTDDTIKIAEEMGTSVVTQKGSGKGDAIAAAIAYAQAVDVDYVAFIDADYTYPAEYLPKMIRMLEDDPDLGMVCGNRFNGNPGVRAMRNLFYLGNRFLAFTHKFLNSVQLQDPLTGMRVARWEILKNWKPRSKSFDVEAELNVYVEKKGYGITEIPIRYRQRLGEKKLKLRDGFTILKRIVSETL
jgi:glycosyltransferase involved in cell wall biosynthesis